MFSFTYHNFGNRYNISTVMSRDLQKTIYKFLFWFLLFFQFDFQFRGTGLLFCKQAACKENVWLSQHCCSFKVSQFEHFTLWVSLWIFQLWLCSLLLLTAFWILTLCTVNIGCMSWVNILMRQFQISYNDLKTLLLITKLKGKYSHSQVKFFVFFLYAFYIFYINIWTNFVGASNLCLHFTYYFALEIR